MTKSETGTQSGVRTGAASNVRAARHVASEHSLPTADELHSIAGRAAETAELAETLERVRIGRPSLVWIEGETGMGKTSLLRYLIAGAPDFAVFVADAVEAEELVPSAVAQQLLKRIGGVGADATTARRLPVAGRVDPALLGMELLALLDSPPDEAPVMIVVDDVQWCDAASWQALWFALRRARSERLLVALAGRPAASAALGDPWRRLAGGFASSRIQIGPLDEAAVAEMWLGKGIGELPPGAAERLRAHTGGNPLHVSALLEELSVEELCRPGGELPAPRSFANHVLARLADLPVAVQRLAYAAAVVDSPASTVELMSLMSASTAAQPGARDGCEWDVADALEAAAASELFDVSPTGSVSLAHSLVRSAVYASIPLGELADLHRAAAGICEGERALAHQVCAARLAGAPVPALLEEIDASLGASLASGDYVTAAKLSEWAASLAGSEGERDLRTLHSVLFLCLARDVHHALARARSVEVCPPSSLRELVLGGLAFVQGDGPSARSHLSAAASSPPGTLEHALASALLAAEHFQQGRFSEAEEGARAAMAYEGGPTIRTIGASIAAFSIAASGDAERARSVLAASESSLTTSPRDAADLAAAAAIVDASDGAVDDKMCRVVGRLSSLLRAPVERQPRQFLAPACASLAECELRLGAWDDACVHAELALAISGEAGWTWASFPAMAVLAYVAAARGDSRAPGMAAAARDEASSHASWISRIYADLAGSYVERARGDFRAVRETLLPWAEGPLGRGLSATHVPWVTLALAEAELRCGFPSEARVRLTAIGRSPRFMAMQPVRMERHRLLAADAHEGGDSASALAELEAGLSTGAPGAFPFERANLLLAHGGLLRRNGKRRQAVAPLREARDLLLALRAAPLIERCDEELAACGLPSGSAGSKGPLDLSAQQATVARLAASGLTNREIAAELYLGVKTVEYHLAQVFTKLGVSTRRELGRALSGGRETDLGL